MDEDWDPADTKRILEAKRVIADPSSGSFDIFSAREELRRLGADGRPADRDRAAAERQQLMSTAANPTANPIEAFAERERLKELEAMAQPIERKDAGEAVYPDDVLQNIARELTILHTLETSPMADELDQRLSFELWCQVEYFLLYLIENAIRASERLHPNSKSRLAHLLIEEWIAYRKPLPNPSSGIVARTIVSVLIKTGVNAKLDRDGYRQFRTVCESFLNSPYRKTELKDCGDPTALTVLFISRVKDGHTEDGRPIRFSGTVTELDSLLAQVTDYFARAVQRIQNLLY